MEEIVIYLQQEGFLPSLSRDKDVPCFCGTVNIDGRDILLEIRFIHRELDYPEVYLKEWEFDKALRQTMGMCHINSKGKICHTDDSRAWWDAGQAVRLTIGVVHEVKSLLSNNLLGKSNPDEIIRDFGGYWDANKTLYLSEFPKNKDVFAIRERNGILWLVSETQPLPWLQVYKASATPWVVVHLKKAPIPPVDNWPPMLLRDISNWVLQDEQQNSTAIYNVLSEKIFSASAKKSRKYTPSEIGIIFTWPDKKGGTDIGAAFKFQPDKTLVTAIEQGRSKGISGLLKQSITKIERYGLQRADQKYIHARNIPSEDNTLQNKKVLLIGAGAIGSFLSQILCSMGAGIGKKGTLTIIDFDAVKPENVGRHLLGIESLGVSKVEALYGRLNNAFPHLTIKPVVGSILDHHDLLRGQDIVIDATGSQTAAIGIEKILSTMEDAKRPPVVHSWIQGQGIATVAHLNESRKDACYRCLWKLDPHDRYIFRYPLTKDIKDDEPVFGGCHQSFHPYVATAAMMAAVQAADMLNDWLNNRVKNKLIFKILQASKCQNRPDCIPNKSLDCPICNARK